MTEPYQHVVFVVALIVAGIGAVLDWKRWDIPHWLTLPAFGIAPLLHIGRFGVAKAPHDLALQEGAFSLGGALLAGIVPLLLFRRGALGGGDLKLFVALGALLQPMHGIEAQMYGFFAGAILAPARLTYEGKLLSTLKNAFTIGQNMFLPKDRQRPVDASAFTWFRLGPAIFLGVLLTVYLHW